MALPIENRELDHADTPITMTRRRPETDSLQDEGISLGFDSDRIAHNDICIGKEIGVGGFGTVYRATWKDRTVAVKVSRNESDESSTLFNEARVCSNLVHGNIVTFLGVTEIDSRTSLVMECCEGGPLSNVLLRKENIPPTVLVSWAQQIADGMEYLHTFWPEKPVIHGDLKSSNILLNQRINTYDESSLSESVVKICDFGLAQCDCHATEPSAVHESNGSPSCTGTLPWVAPEAIRHKSLTCASDVWSFGVVLWELLTSDVPYRNVEKWTVAYGVSRECMTLPTPKTCPAKLRQLVEGCWSQVPTGRPSFHSITDTLSGFTETDFAPVTGVPFSTVQCHWRSEIANIFKELCAKEQELRSLEKEIEVNELEQEKARRALQRRSEALAQREFVIIDREIELSMMEYEGTPHPPVHRYGTAGGHKRSVFQFIRQFSLRSLDERCPSLFSDRKQLLLDFEDNSEDDGFASPESLSPGADSQGSFH